MKFDKHKFNIVYTVIVFVALASVDNAVIGLIPPLFSSIAKDLKTHVSTIGMISSINILVISVSSVVWAYLADKGKRKKLIVIGTIIWSVSVYLTSQSENYIQLTIFQIFTGIGLGCIGSIGFSLLTDCIPNQYRGLLMSLWGLAQGFGVTTGGLMASLVTPTFGWRASFRVIAVIGTIFIFLYFYIKEPQKGSADPELKALTEKGYDYNYTIEFDQIHDIINKQSNKWLILQGFFVNIATGTLIWLPTLYISKIINTGYNNSTALIASGFLYSILQMGGTMSIFFGYLGDKIQKRSLRGRALLASISNFAAVPLYIAMFCIPMKNLSIAVNNNPISVLLSLLKEFVGNPWMLTMLLLALSASAAQSANSPNWLALITDVNLPEHRATAFSIANLVSGIGRSLGNVLVGIVLKIISPDIPEPTSYIISLSVFQLFFIPAGFCCIVLYKKSKKDIIQIKAVLKKRAEKFNTTNCPNK